MSRRVWFVIAILLGIGIGLLYGWVVNPIQYVDTTPSTLRADYRADYVLMVAETYRMDGNIDQAARRLAFLGDTIPVKMVSEAILYARQTNYAAGDLELMIRLSQALQSWIPPAGGGS